MERFILNKLNKVEGKKRYSVEVSNTVTSSEDLDTEVNINSSWKTIKDNIKISVNKDSRLFLIERR
jgi:hypothetical protein